MSCHCHNEITRDGSGQLNRYLKALDPSYAPIDDRNIEDLLVYAKRYASQIRFYDTPDSGVVSNEPVEKISWREFFRRDMAVIAASVANWDFLQVKKDYDETRKRLDENPKPELFAALFNPILGIATKIDSWYSIAIPDNPLYGDLTIGIQSSLKAALNKVREYEEGFKLVDPYTPLSINYAGIKNKNFWELDHPVKANVSIYEGQQEKEKIRNATLYVDDIFLTFYSFVSNLVNSSDRYLTFALEEYPSHQPHMALFITFLRLFQHARHQMNGITERLLNYYYRDVLQLKEKPSIPDKVYVVFELAKDIANYDLAKGTALDGGKDGSGIGQVYKTRHDLVINQAKVKELKTIFLEKNQGDGVLTTLYARPVANSQDGYGEKFTDPYPKWPTFGKGSDVNRNFQNICEQLNLLQDQYYYKNETMLGFAIASPHLLLQGGKRVIIYRLMAFQKIFDEKVINEERIVQIKLTSQKNWLKIEKQMNQDNYQSLKTLLDEGTFPDQEYETSYFFDLSENLLLIYLPLSEDPITAFDAEVHEGSFKTDHPVMQILMGPAVQLDLADFKDMRFSDSTMEVRVGTINNDGARNANFDGLKTLLLQNDDGLIDSSTVYDPFTAYPSMGRSLYIGSDEVFNKNIDQLSVNILFAANASTKNNFTLDVLKDRSWIRLIDSTNGNDLSRNVLSEVGELTRTPLSFNDRYSGKSTKGFLQLTLNTTVSGERLFEKLQELALQLKIKEISLSYHATLRSLQAGVDQLFHVYPFGVLQADLRIPSSPKKGSSFAFSQSNTRPLDFTRQEIDLLSDVKGSLLPQFTFLDPYAKYNSPTEKEDDYENLYNGGIANGTETVPRISRKKNLQRIATVMLDASGMEEKLTGSTNQYSGETQEEGMLFIGLENLKPLQSVSLLFQFAEGTAQDEDNDPPVIHWSYLKDNEWKPLRQENIISDDTYGFQATGIIKIDVPADATFRNTIITDGLIWFCASATENTNRIPYLIDIVAQAVQATFEDNNNNQTHFNNALPAGSISKLVTKVAEVGKVIQPFASWNGKHAEVGPEFYTRVSERLRHKNRAINAWDYEHLILDRFKDIYKVKAITHSDPNCFCRHPEDTIVIDQVDDCCGSQIAPGHVLIVPIADFKNRHALNPLQPKTGRRTLLEIQDYLKSRTSPFVKIHAKNPVYEEVIVFFRVKFYAGVDKGYHLKKLNDEIIKFLTPWAFDENVDVKFGEKVYASSVINFIEERPYVDFITDFLMGVCKDECCPSEEEHQNHTKLPESSPILPPESVPVVKGLVLDYSLNPLQGATVRLRDTAHNTVTNNNGEFILTNVPTTLTIMVSLAGYESAELFVLANHELKFYLRQDNQDNDGGDEDVKEVLSHICGCHDFEELIQQNASEQGVVVAIPSTSRSILVSARKHIIVPYEAPEKPDPCKTNKAADGSMKIKAREIVPQPIPGLDKATRKTQQKPGAKVAVTKREGKKPSSKKKSPGSKK
jgi:hypothetical protein